MHLSPINILPSLSRLMKDGIGEGYTRADHRMLNQLFSSYSKVQEVRHFSNYREEDLTEIDRKYMEFGRAFEGLYCPGPYENRDINTTLDLAWEILRILPKDSLTR